MQPLLSCLSLIYDSAAKKLRPKVPDVSYYDAQLGHVLPKHIGDDLAELAREFEQRGMDAPAALKLAAAMRRDLLVRYYEESTKPRG